LIKVKLFIICHNSRLLYHYGICNWNDDDDAVAAAAAAAATAVLLQLLLLASSWCSVRRTNLSQWIVGRRTVQTH